MPQSAGGRFELDPIIGVGESDRTFQCLSRRAGDSNRYSTGGYTLDEFSFNASVGGRAIRTADLPTIYP